MFKFLHHVPLDLMDDVLQEIGRILKPGGILYISEPIFKGDFNQIIRLFHNEEYVRQKAINTNAFTMVDEIFFNSPSIYENFKQVEDKIIKVTHTEHHLPNELYIKVKEKFDYYFQQYKGHFISPIRVDILRK